MKLPITVLTLFVSFQTIGQTCSFLKTTGKNNLQYIELCSNNVKVYKMGRYFDKVGTGPAILNIDTLVFTKSNEFKGRIYTLLKSDTIYTLISNNGKKYQTEPQSELQVNTALNNAYCLKSYFDLSDKINKKFPLYHYTFRNGYYAWESDPDKSIHHDKFVEQKDKEIRLIYDSISKNQIAFTKTTQFVTAHAEKVDYSILKDSMSTLPIDYRPESGYFDQCVYQMVKADPAYFYELLQDFPTSKKFIYLAVQQDKELVKQLKQVQGYDDLKKEFLKEYRFDKTMKYRIFGVYAITAGLLTWLIMAQP